MGHISLDHGTNYIHVVVDNSKTTSKIKMYNTYVYRSNIYVTILIN